MHARKVHRIFSLWQSRNPTPTTELRYRSPFQLLIAVILSAQTTDKMVNEVSRDLFRHAPDAKSLAALSPGRITTLIARIGLYRNKARFIRECSQILVREYGGRVPKSREELIRLPGVGRKTANVVLNTLYGQAEIAVDTHIFRVANRMGLVSAKTVLATELALKEVVPAKFQRHAHHWLILHGRYVCKAIKPQCRQCLVSRWCEYEDRPDGAVAGTAGRPDRGKKRKRAQPKALENTN